MRKPRRHKVEGLSQGHPAVKDQEAWLSCLLLPFTASSYSIKPVSPARVQTCDAYYVSLYPQVLTMLFCILRVGAQCLTHTGCFTNICGMNKRSTTATDGHVTLHLQGPRARYSLVSSWSGWDATHFLGDLPIGNAASTLPNPGALGIYLPCLGCLQQLLLPPWLKE